MNVFSIFVEVSLTICNETTTSLFSYQILVLECGKEVLESFRLVVDLSQRLFVLVHFKDPHLLVVLEVLEEEVGGGGGFAFLDVLC